MQPTDIASLSSSSCEAEVAMCARAINFLPRRHKVVSKYYYCASSIAHVPFIGQVKVLSCDHHGLRYHNSTHGVTLVIPKDAIPKEAGIVHFEFAVALYGPFSVPHGQRIISPILWLCPQEDFELKMSIQITLPHFLVGITKNYNKHEVGFVKACHNDYELYNGQYRYKFTTCSDHSKPQWSFDGQQSYGTLKTNHFCYLCIKENVTLSHAKAQGYYLLCFFKSGACVHSSDILPWTSSWPTSLHYCVAFFLPTCKEVHIVHAVMIFWIPKPLFLNRLL